MIKVQNSKIQVACVTLLILMSGSSVASADNSIDLAGLPMQMAWSDVNQDGQEDLIALMVETHTEGVMDTWFSDNGLQGVYADQTHRPKFLVTYLQEKGSWTLVQKIALGEMDVLGFACSKNDQDSYLMIWQMKELLRHRWTDSGWEVERHLETPGLLAEGAALLNDFPFWHESEAGAFWFVPDFGGIHVVSVGPQTHTQFIPFPPETFDNSKVSHVGHVLNLRLPRLLQVHPNPVPELAFQNDKMTLAYQLGSATHPFRAKTEGMLADFNGDGMVDLMKGQPEDVERMKDMAHVRTKIQVYLAKAPLVFSEKPVTDQWVQGLVINDGDEDTNLEIAQPFLDLNHDGLGDLAGIAVKLSILQASRLMITGKMTIQFLLSLSVQEKNGTFRTLAGGPFPMEWKLNLRRLTMPTFAELTADFDGDGWSDLLMERSSELEITPVTAAGIGTKPYKRKLAADLQDPDHVYGRDLDGDGKASCVVIKLLGKATKVGILEVRP